MVDSFNKRVQVFHYFGSQQAAEGGKNREIFLGAGLLDCCLLGLLAPGRRLGTRWACTILSPERLLRVHAGQPGMHILPCAAQWAWRRHSVVEPDVFARPITLHQHHLSPAGQYAAAPRRHQQLVSELS